MIMLVTVLLNNLRTQNIVFKIVEYVIILIILCRIVDE